MEKECIDCLITMSLDAFYPAPSCRLGVTPRCKKCHKFWLGTKTVTRRKSYTKKQLNFEIILKSGKRLVHTKSHLIVNDGVITVVDNDEKFFYPLENVEMFHEYS